MDIDTARGVAARIWCDPDYEHVIMNPDLAEEIALILMGEANHQAAQHKMHPTLGESAASDSESKPAPKRVI